MTERLRTWHFKGTSVSNGSGRGSSRRPAWKTELGRNFRVSPRRPRRTRTSSREAYSTALSRRAFCSSGHRSFVAALVSIRGPSSPVAICSYGRDRRCAHRRGRARRTADRRQIALARGMRRLAERNALIERLSAVETLGADERHLARKDRYAD